MSEEKLLTKVVFRDDGKVETLWAFDLGEMPGGRPLETRARYSVREKVVIRTHPMGIPLHSTADGGSNGASVTTLATVLSRVPNLRRDWPQASVEDVRTSGRIAEGWPSTTMRHYLGVPGSMRCAKVGQRRQERVVSLHSSETR
jgi:hypothetical protein